MLISILMFCWFTICCFHAWLRLIRHLPSYDDFMRRRRAPIFAARLFSRAFIWWFDADIAMLCFISLAFCLRRFADIKAIVASFMMRHDAVVDYLMPYFSLIFCYFAVILRCHFFIFLSLFSLLYIADILSPRCLRHRFAHSFTPIFSAYFCCYFISSLCHVAIYFYYTLRCRYTLLLRLPARHHLLLFIITPHAHCCRFVGRSRAAFLILLAFISRRLSICSFFYYLLLSSPISLFMRLPLTPWYCYYHWWLIIMRHYVDIILHAIITYDYFSWLLISRRE